jgi:hypothetical protein
MAFAADERPKAQWRTIGPAPQGGALADCSLLLSKALELVETGVPRTTRHAAAVEAPIARDPLAQ